MSPKQNWFTFLAIVCVSAISAAAEPAKSKSPELQVLQRLVGTWDFEGISRVAAFTPAELRAKFVVTREWVLDGQSLQETRKHPDGDSILMYSFDAQRKAYRSKLFFSEILGQWDESSQTLAFASDGTGLTITSTIKFVDEDTHNLTTVIKDAQGKLLFDAEAKFTRRK
jgi:cysteine synthase